MKQEVITVQSVGVIKPPVSGHTMTPEEFAKGHRTVTVVFEKPVTLTIKHGEKVHFPKGPHEVPEQHADHWYLKANGAQRYSRPVAVGETVPQSQSGRRGPRK